MVEKWDATEPPMHQVIFKSDDAPPPEHKRLGAVIFVAWSAFMLVLGFLIAMAVNGHIIIR